MANGVSLSQLRRDIALQGIEYPLQRIIDACYDSCLKNLPVTGARDSAVLALPSRVWEDIITHIGAHKYIYGKDIKVAQDLNDTRRDCDDYMDYLKGRAGLELTVNGVIAVLDYSSAHAYCAMVVRTGGREVIVRPMEPQLGKWISTAEIGKHKSYQAKTGELRL